MEQEAEVRVQAVVAAEARAVAAVRAAADYRTIPVDELTAHTWQFEGQQIVLTGTIMGVELTMQGEEFLLLERANPNDPIHSGDAAIEWPGSQKDIKQGQVWTV